MPLWLIVLLFLVFVLFLFIIFLLLIFSLSLVLLLSLSLTLSPSEGPESQLRRPPLSGETACLLCMRELYTMYGSAVSLLEL